jgi:hypothetical protein
MAFSPKSSTSSTRSRQRSSTKASAGKPAFMRKRRK